MYNDAAFERGGASRLTKESISKLIGAKAKNKLGEEIEIVNVVDDEDFSNVIILGNNGKSYGLEFVFTKNILIFDNLITDLINGEIHHDLSIKEIKDKEEDEKLLEEKKENKRKLVLPPEYDPQTTICWFRGEYNFLSNMYDSPVTYKGVTYTCVESAFHAQKDSSRVNEFVNLKGVQSKKLGRTVNLRSDWENVKLGIMEELVRNKFTQNEELKNKLLNTGSLVIVEGNFWNDRYWGICRGKGENHLGEILMKVRKELRSK